MADKAKGDVEFVVTGELSEAVYAAKDPPLFSNAIHRATRRPNRASPEAFPGGPGDGASEELRDLARNVWEIAARDLKASEPGMYVGQKFLE